MPEGSPGLLWGEQPVSAHRERGGGALISERLYRGKQAANRVSGFTMSWKRWCHRKPRSLGGSEGAVYSHFTPRPIPILAVEDTANQ